MYTLCRSLAIAYLAIETTHILFTKIFHVKAVNITLIFFVFFTFYFYFFFECFYFFLMFFCDFYTFYAFSFLFILFFSIFTYNLKYQEMKVNLINNIENYDVIEHFCYRTQRTKNYFINDFSFPDRNIMQICAILIKILSIFLLS